MKVFLHNECLFDVEAEMLCLPVDGTAKGMGGSLVRQYIKLIGDVAWADIEEQVTFPFPNGRVELANGVVDSQPYDFVCLLGTLTHEQGVNPEGAARWALKEAVELAATWTVRRVAVPLLTGGPRISPVKALHLMLDVAAHQPKGEMHIAILDKATYDMAVPVVR